MLNKYLVQHLQHHEKQINERKIIPKDDKLRKKHLCFILDWFYRILPAVLHEPFSPIPSELITNQWDISEPNPNQTRWKPFHIPSVEDEKKDFLDVKTDKEFERDKIIFFELEFSNSMWCW